LKFVYTGLPMRVVFGAGAVRELPAELERLGAKRALVLSTPEQAASAAEVAKALGSRAAGTYDKAAMHVPIEIAEDARRMARELGADCCVTVGGGSTTGLGKAIALDSGLPILAVPTTYAGSEMTPIYGLTEGGQKRTGRDVRVLPKTVIYDPELTMTLPLALSITSGVNAIAHAAEGLYTPQPNPIIALMAEQGIAALARALPALHADARDRRARHDALYGAWLCGATLGHVAMGLHHKLCHTLGGSFNLPHAETHTVVLPHALAYNAAAAPQAMASIARAMGVGDAAGDPLAAARAIHAFTSRLGAPIALLAIGMPADGLDRAADLAAQTPYPNPRALDRQALRALLQRDYDGAAPQA